MTVQKWFRSLSESPKGGLPIEILLHLPYFNNKKERKKTCRQSLKGVDVDILWFYSAPARP